MDFKLLSKLCVGPQLPVENGPQMHCGLYKLVAQGCAQPDGTGSGSSQGAGKTHADQSGQPQLHSANETFLPCSPGYQKFGLVNGKSFVISGPELSAVLL